MKSGRKGRLYPLWSVLLLFLTFSAFFTTYSVLNMQVKFVKNSPDLQTASVLAEPNKNVQASRKLNFLQDDKIVYDNNLFANDFSSNDDDEYDNDFKKRLPQAIILGVKKGGTRALIEILRMHPDVKAPGPEPHFFDANYEKGLEWYRDLMPPSLNTQLTMEKTPKYFVTPEAPSRIYNMSRTVLFLVVVRDPVTRAVSDFVQSTSKNSAAFNFKNFEEMAFLNSTTGLVDTNWSAIKIGVYAKHCERWFSYFPRSQFHFVSGEGLVSDPVSELVAVQKFLGLRPYINSSHFAFSTKKGFRFPCLKRHGKSVPRCLSKSKGRSHPPILTSTEQRLRDFYRPFNKKFYKMVNRDFGWT